MVRSDRKGPRQFGTAHAERSAAGRRGEAFFEGGGCKSPGEAVSAEAPAAVPRCLRGYAAAAPREPLADNFVRPSDTDEEGHVVRTGKSWQLRARALQRGKLVHRLLQSLPDVRSEGRLKAALRYLARNAGEWAEDERETLAAQVLSLIGDISFAAVFAPGSRAEVSIAGRLDRPGRTAGAGIRPDRPAGGDAGRSADRRLQDQPCPASRHRRGAYGLYPPARALPGCFGQALSPAGRSAPRCCGPKRLK